MKNTLKKIILAVSMSTISLVGYAAQSQKLGCAEVLNRVPVEAAPINSEAFIQIKNAGGGTGGLAAQVLSAIPGAGILSVAAGSLVADSVANQASEAFFNDDRIKGKVYAVTFKFDDGNVLTLPILKDSTSLFTNNRVTIAAITDDDKIIRWGFPKTEFVVPRTGEENYEKICVNNVNPDLVKKLQVQYEFLLDKPKAAK